MSKDDSERVGTEERTENSVVEVTYKSLERGTLKRFLRPGEQIDLPADRVEVRCLETDPDDGGE